MTPESALASKVHTWSCKGSSVSAWIVPAGGGARGLLGHSCALRALKGLQDSPGCWWWPRDGHFLLPNPSYKSWSGLVAPCPFSYPREIWRRLMKNGMGNPTSSLAGGMIQGRWRAEPTALALHWSLPSLQIWPVPETHRESGRPETPETQNSKPESWTKGLLSANSLPGWSLLASGKPAVSFSNALPPGKRVQGFYSAQGYYDFYLK